jgi:hypothetical protein
MSSTRDGCSGIGDGTVADAGSLAEAAAAGSLEPALVSTTAAEEAPPKPSCGGSLNRSCQRSSSKLQFLNSRIAVRDWYLKLFICAGRDGQSAGDKRALTSVGRNVIVRVLIVGAAGGAGGLDARFFCPFCPFCPFPCFALIFGIRCGPPWSQATESKKLLSSQRCPQSRHLLLGRHQGGPRGGLLDRWKQSRCESKNSERLELARPCPQGRAKHDFGCCEGNSQHQQSIESGQRSCGTGYLFRQ